MEVTCKEFTDLCDRVRNLEEGDFKFFVDIVREEQKFRSRRKMAEIRVGDVVSFALKKRGLGARTVRGCVTRFGRSMVHVNVDPSFGVGTKWRVAPSLLTKVEVKLEVA